MALILLLLLIAAESWLLMLTLGACGLAVGYLPSVLLCVVVWFIAHTDLTIT